MVGWETVDGLDVLAGGGGTDTAVLYLPSWRDHAAFDGHVTEFVTSLVDDGVATLAAPYRGLLDQPGEYRFTSMIDDAVDCAEILHDRAEGADVVAVGNSVGGIPAIGAAAESDLVVGALTMNAIFGFADEDWWHAEDAYRRRCARWSLIAMGEDGPFGTGFHGLDEAFYTDVVCRGQDRVLFDERVDELEGAALQFLVSHRDPMVDPLHTWSLYRRIRNRRAGRPDAAPVAIEVVPREDPDHGLLPRDPDLRETVVSWVEEL